MTPRELSTLATLAQKAKEVQIDVETLKLGFEAKRIALALLSDEPSTEVDVREAVDSLRGWAKSLRPAAYSDSKTTEEELAETKKLAKDLYDLWQDAKGYMGDYFSEKHGHDDAEVKYSALAYDWLRHVEPLTPEQIEENKRAFEEYLAKFNIKVENDEA